jgi:hypothetical protein
MCIRPHIYCQRCLGEWPGRGRATSTAAFGRRRRETTQPVAKPLKLGGVTGPSGPRKGLVNTHRRTDNFKYFPRPVTADINTVVMRSFDRWVPQHGEQK